MINQLITHHIFNQWTYPELISANEIGESIEFIYKETSSVTTFGMGLKPEQRVFKIIFSCKNGKWNRSERIYGEIIPASTEQYLFK